MAILGLMGRADPRVKFAGGICSSTSMQIGPVGMMSASVRICDLRDIHAGDG